MTRLEHYQAQLERCCGKFPRQYVKPGCEESEYPGVLPAECPKCGEPIWGEGWNPKTGVRYFSHKPQPDSSSIPDGHKSGWHYGYITCSCGWAWDSRTALTGELDTKNGLRMFEKHRDSSSISTEPEPIVDDEEIQAAIDDHKTFWSEEIAIELQQWRKWAKGQSNGR